MNKMLVINFFFYYCCLLVVDDSMEKRNILGYLLVDFIDNKIKSVKMFF